MIDRDHDLSLVRQAKVLSISRGSVYYKPRPVSPEDLAIMRRIDELHLEYPFAGSRMLRDFLNRGGVSIGRRHVATLMKRMSIEALYRKPNTSKPSPGHKIYPYLLRGVEVTKANHVWSIDITYIRLARGFAYLVAIIDWYSRKVLSWRLSNSMDASFCVDCLEEALRQYGRPQLFNSDQGSQFTSTAFTDVLKRERITISMDGRGRAFDNIFVERLWRNVKYEDVYLKGYAKMPELTVGLAQYFAFYNAERPHQALGYQTPDAVYRADAGGGALIIDRFSDEREKAKGESATGQRRAADAVEMDTA